MQGRRGGRSRLMVLFALLALASSPAILSILLIHALFDVGVDHFVPSTWNDQVAYWHKIAAFAAVGFDTGYNTPDEQSLPWDAVRFGVNGPWLAVIYGSVARVVGWGTASSIPFNMVVVGAGLAIYGWLAALDLKRIALVGVVALTTWPLLLYIPTASFESVQQSIAVILAGCFVRAIDRGPKLGRVERYASVTFLLAASLTRFSWALLLPCLLVLYWHRPSARQVAVAVLAGVLASAALLRVVGLFQPPGFNSVTDALAGIRSDPVSGLRAFAGQSAENLTAFLYPGGRSTLDEASKAEDGRVGSLDITAAQSWETIGLLVFAALAIAGALGWGRLRAVTARLPPREAMFHTINLGGMTLAAVFLYIPSGYYRVLGAHVLLSLLVLAARFRVALVAPIVVINLVLFPSFLDTYYGWRVNFTFDNAALDRQRVQFGSLVRYTNDASSPWCNTLYMPVDGYDWRVTLIPRGVAVAAGVNEPMPSPPKSRYVLSPTVEGDRAPSLKAAYLRPLGEVPAGRIYENLRSDCAQAPRE